MTKKRCVYCTYREVLEQTSHVSSLSNFSICLLKKKTIWPSIVRNLSCSNYHFCSPSHFFSAFIVTLDYLCFLYPHIKHFVFVYVWFLLAPILPFFNRASYKSCCQSLNLLHMVDLSHEAFGEQASISHILGWKPKQISRLTLYIALVHQSRPIGADKQAQIHVPPNCEVVAFSMVNRQVRFLLPVPCDNKRFLNDTFSVPDELPHWHHLQRAALVLLGHLGGRS